MMKYNMKDKELVNKGHLKIYQRMWLHLLPSILIYGDGMEGRWSKISSIEIAWLHWEIEIYFYKQTNN